MRDVINKNVTEEELLHTVNVAFTEGWTRVKLYFMIGLPTETLEDVRAIVDLGKLVVDAFFANKEKPKEEWQVPDFQQHLLLCAKALYTFSVVWAGYHGNTSRKATGIESR